MARRQKHQLQDLQRHAHDSSGVCLTMSSRHDALGQAAGVAWSAPRVSMPAGSKAASTGHELH
jgi:hypothetical protein